MNEKLNELFKICGINDFVFHLQREGEKIIYNILQKKKGIIDQVMGDGEYSESFSRDLLKNLF